MVLTRQEKQQEQQKQLNYIVEEVFGKGKDSNIAKALKTHGYDSVPDLMMAGMSEINVLDFKNDEGDIFELLTSERNLLWVSQGYYQQCVNQGQSFKSTEDYKQLNSDDFNEFHITCQFSSMTPVTPTSSTPTTSSKPSTSSAVRDFHKGTKRDMNLFPTLRDPAKWDSFEREFEAVARSQNLHKVLDS